MLTPHTLIKCAFSDCAAYNDASCAEVFACSPKDADSQCISDASKLCDNVCDCGNCADEENCLALAPTDLPMDPDSTKSLHVSGLLHWKVNGRFHPLSLHSNDQVRVGISH